MFYLEFFYKAQNILSVLWVTGFLKHIFFNYRQESAKLRGLHGNVGYVGAWIVWVKFLRGLSGLRDSKYFLFGSNIILCRSYCRSKIFAVFFFFRGSAFI